MILLTGANGFVGHMLYRSLITQGMETVAVSRRPITGINTVTIPDINANTDWSACLDRVQTVIHTAARVHIMHDLSADPLSEFRQTNVQATVNLATQAAEAGVKRFVFLSSIKVNGEQTFDQPFNERDAVAPQDPYAISKYEAEQSLRKIEAETGMEVVIIRPPLIYGEGVKANFQKLLDVVSRGVPLPLKFVNNKRSFIGLHNLTDFITLCLTHPRAAGETFLISDGEDMSTPELIQRIAKAFNKKIMLLPVPLWLMRCCASALGKKGAVDRLFGSLQVDSTKARTLLGWQPVMTVQEQLELTAQYYLGSKRTSS